MLRESSAQAFSAMAQTGIEAMIPYYDQAMPILLKIFIEESKSGFRGTVLESMTLLGVAVGKEKFNQ